MLAVDVRPEGNTPSSIGKIETCASYEVGDQFPVDIIVNNVANLRSFELRVDYDEDILSVLAVDFAQFLVSTPPGGNVFPTLNEVEVPGRYFLAAAELQGTPDTGSGVLVKVTFEAIGEGISPVEVADSPAYAGPRLSGALGQPIEDSTGDGIWDASIVGSTVNVGDDCGGSPVVTLKPSPKPSPTSRTPSPSGATPANTATQAPGSTDDPGSTQPTSNPGADGSSPTASGGAQPSATTLGNDIVNNVSNDGDGNSDGTGSGATGSSSGDSGSASTLLLIIGGVAILFVSAGGGLFAFSRRLRD